MQALIILVQLYIYPYSGTSERDHLGMWYLTSMTKRKLIED